MSGSGVLEIAHVPASVGLKPLPEIVTVVEPRPELGFREIVGLGVVTVNEAVAKSPAVFPLTVTE
jgi:hypothetical protein